MSRRPASLQDLEQGPERSILVGLAISGREPDLARQSLSELQELVHSARAEVVASFFQERKEPDPALYVGRGKLEEVREALMDNGAGLVVFDDELNPAQQRNIENFLDCKVIDRSELILDIFAQRARSREGKLQVELAQLQYLLPRLSGKGLSLSRLGGGIGTRGPGETKLETDRRTVRRRISTIRKQLSRLEIRRELQRQKRKRVPITTVSFVGYTNAGKSTLFNRLASETTVVNERMFATLDPLVRKISLPSGQEILVTDTVGFIRKLPHTLVAAFHATLEETLESDLLLHVVDLSDPHHRLLRRAVYEVLEEIGAEDIPIIEVYNKVDLLAQHYQVSTSYESVQVSALSGAGVDQLLSQLDERTSRDFRTVDLTIPFERGEILASLRERGRIESTEYRPDGVHVKLALRVSDLGRYRRMLNSESRIQNSARPRVRRLRTRLNNKET